MSGSYPDEEQAADCAACPVGFLRDVMREAQPEAALHLVTAARELLLAFDTMLRATEQTLQRDVDAGGAAGESRREPRRERPSRVRHIDIA